MVQMLIYNFKANKFKQDTKRTLLSDFTMLNKKLPVGSFSFIVVMVTWLTTQHMGLMATPFIQVIITYVFSVR